MWRQVRQNEALLYTFYGERVRVSPVGQHKAPPYVLWWEGAFSPVCLIGVSHRCVSLVCLTDVSHRCVSPVCSPVCLIGVPHRCVSSVCLTGVSHGCVSPVCLAGVSHRWVSPVRGLGVRISVRVRGSFQFIVSARRLKRQSGMGNIRVLN